MRRNANSSDKRAGIPKLRRVEMITFLVDLEVNRLTPERVLARVKGVIRERFWWMPDDMLQEKYDRALKKHNREP